MPRRSEDQRPDKPTQPTQPKTDAEPLEIPIPTREQFLRDLRKVSEPEPPTEGDSDDDG